MAWLCLRRGDGNYLTKALFDNIIYGKLNQCDGFVETMALPCLRRDDDFRLPYITITKNALIYEYFIVVEETRQCHCLYENINQDLESKKIY